MHKIFEEKRAYSRIKASLKIEASKNIVGNSIDLSEGGVSFSSTDIIASPSIQLQIHFSDIKPEFKAKAKLVWKRDVEGANSLYGVEFIGLNEAKKALLRQELIKTQISGLLAEIKNAETKKEIYNFFLKDVLGYISEVIKLTSPLSKESEYSAKLENNLKHLNDQLVLKGYCLEEQLSDKTTMQKAKDSFRHLLGTWVYKSVIMKHGFDKPRGYPGDYKMLEIVYDNKPISKSIGRYFDNYFLKNPYAVAVRIRKDRLREMLTSLLNGTNLNKINILNVACGSCREIKELLPSLKTKSHIAFNCLDWDDEALQFSKNVLLSIAPNNVRFNFIKEDVLNIVKGGHIVQSLEKQDVVYSIGLIDYLPDRILSKLICALYQLMQKDGKLILTHKNKEKTFPPIPPDWFCDWKFVSRSKDEVVELFYKCGMSNFLLSTETDDFEYICYFTITKK